MSSSCSLPHQPQLDDVVPSRGVGHRCPAAGVDGDDVELGLGGAAGGAVANAGDRQRRSAAPRCGRTRPPARSRGRECASWSTRRVPSSWIVIGSSTISWSGPRRTPSGVTAVTTIRRVRLRLTTLRLRSRDTVCTFGAGTAAPATTLAAMITPGTGRLIAAEFVGTTIVMIGGPGLIVLGGDVGRVGVALGFGLVDGDRDRGDRCRRQPDVQPGAVVRTLDLESRADRPTGSASSWVRSSAPACSSGSTTSIASRPAPTVGSRATPSTPASISACTSPGSPASAWCIAAELVLSADRGGRAAVGDQGATFERRRRGIRRRRHRSWRRCSCSRSPASGSIPPAAWRWRSSPTPTPTRWVRCGCSSCADRRRLRRSAGVAGDRRDHDRRDDARRHLRGRHHRRRDRRRLSTSMSRATGR